MKPAVSAERLKQEIVKVAHQHPNGRYLEVTDIAILEGHDWGASFTRRATMMMTPRCVFEALSQVQSTFDLQR